MSVLLGQKLYEEEGWLSKWPGINPPPQIPTTTGVMITKIPSVSQAGENSTVQRQRDLSYLRGISVSSTPSAVNVVVTEH